MKLKYFRNRILEKEEELGKGWISRVCYENFHVVNIDLSDIADSHEKIMEIFSNSFLKLIISDAPFLHTVYDIMDQYKGMKIVEFQSGEVQVVIEW